MVHIKNNPELSEAFKNKALKKFLYDLFNDFDDSYTLKNFLKKGFVEAYKQQIDELSNSFRVIEHDKEEKNSYLEVERCIDGVRFRVGDLVVDMHDPEKRYLPIGRMYEDDRGLHVRLDIKEEKAITWRNLSKVEHDLLDEKARQGEMIPNTEEDCY